MDDYLKDIVAARNLRSISISLFGHPHEHFGVYLHWNVGDGAECCGGSGKTVGEAIAHALSEMAERRYPDRERAS